MNLAVALWLAAAAVAPADLKSLPAPMACAGGEPFWTLAIGADGAADYKDDIEETRFRIVRVDNAAGRPTTWRVIFEGARGHALIFDERPACSDSDSDEPPPFGIILEDGDGVVRGCCREAEE